MNDTTRTSAPAMGSATLMLKDEPGGRVSVKLTFDPAVQTDSPCTPAQHEMGALLEVLMRRLTGDARG